MQLVIQNQTSTRMTLDGDGGKWLMSNFVSFGKF